MFKKMTFLLFISMMSFPVCAMTTEIKANTTGQTWPWSLKISSYKWPIANTTGKTISVTFAVNSYIAGSTVFSDRVTLFCNKTIVVQPGGSASCTLSKGSHAEFQIEAQNFKNGSEGSYTVA